MIEHETQILCGYIGFVGTLKTEGGWAVRTEEKVADRDS